MFSIANVQLFLMLEQKLQKRVKSYCVMFITFKVIRVNTRPFFPFSEPRKCHSTDISIYSHSILELNQRRMKSLWFKVRGRSLPPQAVHFVGTTKKISWNLSWKLRIHLSLPGLNYKNRFPVYLSDLPRGMKTSYLARLEL